MTISIFTVALLAASLLIGLIPALFDGLKNLFRERLNLTPGQIEWPIRSFYASWLVGMPMAGCVLDEWPETNKEVLFFTLVVLMLGFAWLALARSFLALKFNAVFLGLGYSFLTTTTVNLMTAAFFPQANLFASLQIGFVAVGTGALLGPWLVTAIESWAGYRQGLLYMSFALIVPAALVALCDKPLVGEDSHSPVTWDKLIVHPYLAVVVGIILVFFAIENCLEFWPEAYLLELGHRGRGLHITTTIFWLAFIGMRAAAAWWLIEHPTHGLGLTLLFVLLAAIVQGNLVSGYEVGSGTLGYWLLGACYGPLLPGLLGIAFSLFSEPLPAAAQGALLALSGLDTLLVRPMMTAFEKGRPARTIMRVPTILALLMAAPLVLMMFLRW